jgi:hypothetical protein
VFVIFPLGLGELVKPFYGDRVIAANIVPAFILSGAFLISTIINLHFLKQDNVK